MSRVVVQVYDDANTLVSEQVVRIGAPPRLADYLPMPTQTDLTPPDENAMARYKKAIATKPKRRLTRAGRARIVAAASRPRKRKSA